MFENFRERLQSVQQDFTSGYVQKLTFALIILTYHFLRVEFP